MCSHEIPVKLKTAVLSATEQLFLEKLFMKIMGKMGEENMPLAKIDERGRVQLPSRLRQKMKLKEGDEFVAEDLGEDTIVLKKINLRALLEDAIVKAKSIDLDKLEKEIEEESNQLARQKYKTSAR
jgi:AbrB family transcriptional regulator (stage V sporulation protein T)